jgi:hypothetical protein
MFGEGSFWISDPETAILAKSGVESEGASQHPITFSMAAHPAWKLSKRQLAGPAIITIFLHESIFPLLKGPMAACDGPVINHHSDCRSA